MSKRTIFTTITPLSPGISRQVVVNFLQDHEEMIDLNPLVKERHPIHPPSHAAANELRCVWYSLTDRISYLPGGMVTGEVTYTCAFNNLPTGIQTHCYAPTGLDIRNRWTVNGSVPGEPVQRVEIGLKGAPLTGLYIREDVDMTCNLIMTPFVKKTLKDSHAALIERLKLKAELASAMHSVSHRGRYSISSVETVDSRKNLSVYNTGNPRHQRTSWHCSTTSSISSSTSPTPLNKNMVVSPPTPPYSPMASSLWSQLQPPRSTTILASLSQLQQKYHMPQPDLVPEPLRIPRSTQRYSHPQHQPGKNNPNRSSFNPSPRRKFSYDSTSSTENYLVSSPATKNNNNDGYPVIQPPIRIAEQHQHVLLQSQNPHRQQPTSPPPQQQTQSNHHDRYEEQHPDYPHLSPYMNGDDDDDSIDDYDLGEEDKGQKRKQEEEAEVVVNDSDSGYADYLAPSTDIGATLNGPFVAAFDEFNICLP